MPISDMSANFLAGQAGKFEPQRQNNALLNIDSLPVPSAGSKVIPDAVTLALDSFPIPKTTVEPLQLTHINERRNLATFAAAEDVTVVYKDFVDVPVAQVLQAPALQPKGTPLWPRSQTS